MEIHGTLEVTMLTTGPFAENCYLLRDRNSGAAILVDPGDEAERILSEVERQGARVERIINTHAHIDHVGAVAEVKRRLDIPFALHPAELPLLEAMPMAAQMFGLPIPEEVPVVDEPIEDGQQFSVGSSTANVILTPGHSPGGCCFYFADEKVLIAGDTLFAGSIGRTDLPGGDGPTLLRSIRDRLLGLPDEVLVYPGHGPRTEIGIERRSNPFLGG